MTAPSIVIRRIGGDEAVQLRDLRLRALADAPQAFGSTLAEARRQPDAFWQERARQSSDGSGQCLFVAAEADRWVGLAGGVASAERAQTVEIVSMWVDPAVRRRGIASRLVEVVASWSRAQGATRLELWVTSSNTPALGLYAALGFMQTGRSQPLPSHPWMQEIEMARGL